MQLKADKRVLWRQPDDSCLQDDESSIGSWGSMCGVVEQIPTTSTIKPLHTGEVQRGTFLPTAQRGRHTVAPIHIPPLAQYEQASHRFAPHARIQRFPQSILGLDVFITQPVK
jgi:hypothetical protein